MLEELPDKPKAMHIRQAIRADGYVLTPRDAALHPVHYGLSPHKLPTLSAGSPKSAAIDDGQR